MVIKTQVSHYCYRRSGRRDPSTVTGKFNYGFYGLSGPLTWSVSGRGLSVGRVPPTGLVKYGGSRGEVGGS